MTGHARLGPSNHRWPHCPGSVREEAQYEDVPGEAAIDGTGSHLLLEMCMDNNVRADVYEGQVIGVNHPDNPMGWLISDDRITRVQMCLDYISRRVSELKEQYPSAVVTVESESKSDPGGAFGRDDWWGTVDITITARNSHTGAVYFIEVCDYKDGRGYVSCTDDDFMLNTQLLSYLFGKLRPHIASGPQKVKPFRFNNAPHARVSIVQPKTNPVVRYEDISTSDLADAVDDMSMAAHRTDDPEAPLIPGKHCQWCKANPKRGGHCTAETNKSLETVKSMNTDVIVTDAGQDMFEYISTAVADPSKLTVEQLSELASARKPLEAAFDKVEKEIERRIETGEQVPGWAMRPGRGSRVWNEDEEVIAKVLRGRRMKKDQIFPAKLLSPAQLEKVDCLTDDQKRKILDQYVTEKSGKLRLTKVAHNESSQELFKDVVQCNTNDVSSPETMFSDAVKKEPTPSLFNDEPAAEVPAATDNEVSFF